jgi:hypothetical protein
MLEEAVSSTPHPHKKEEICLCGNFSSLTGRLELRELAHSSPAKRNLVDNPRKLRSYLEPSIPLIPILNKSFSV